MANASDKFGGGGSVGLRPAAGQTFNHFVWGIGGVVITGVDITSKTLIVDLEGKFALNGAAIINSGTGGNLILSIEVDGRVLMEDLDTGAAVFNHAIFAAAGNNPTQSSPMNVLSGFATIECDQSIKIWMQKTGASNAGIQYNAIALEG